MPVGYIAQDDEVRVLSNAFDEALLKGGFHPAKVRRELGEVGYLKTFKDGDSLRTANAYDFRGRRPRFVVIPKAV